MARDRRGRFTAERTTETIERVTERVTVEPDDTLTELHWAEGWDPGPIHPRNEYLAQRAGQRDQALGLLVLYAQSTPPEDTWRPDGGYYVPVPGQVAWDPRGGHVGPEWLKRQTVNILRAGPAASPLELTLGRSI